MESIKVTFHLRTSMVRPDRPLHLDALLGAALFRMAMRGGDPDPIEASKHLPLAKEQVGEAWCWKASQLSFDTIGGIEWSTATRKYELQKWAEDRDRGLWRGKIDTVPIGTGHQKAYLFNIPLMLATRAYAWCVGDLAAIRGLLHGEIHQLGKDGRAGRGVIDRIDVELSSDNENALWRRRTLPIELEEHLLLGHRRGFGVATPPYWQRSSRGEVWEYDDFASGSGDS